MARSIDEIAIYAKTSPERLCAAARKLRLELGLSVPPAMTDIFGKVLDALEASLGDGAEKATLAMLRSARLADLSGHLLTLPDEVPVGSGTPRLTVAASAVYAALKLLGDTPTPGAS